MTSFFKRNNSSRGDLYCNIISNDFGIQKYLLKIQEQHRLWFTKFRTSNLKLPVEVGRWYGLPRDLRICTFCYKNIGDEFHILFKCPHPPIENLRKKFLPNYYLRYPNINKMYGMFLYCHPDVLKNVSVFIMNLYKLL